MYIDQLESFFPPLHSHTLRRRFEESDLFIATSSSFSMFGFLFFSPSSFFSELPEGFLLLTKMCVAEIYHSVEPSE